MRLLELAVAAAALLIVVAVTAQLVVASRARRRRKRVRREAWLIRQAARQLLTIEFSHVEVIR
jgi:hypothetical protein